MAQPKRAKTERSVIEDLTEAISTTTRRYPPEGSERSKSSQALFEALLAKAGYDKAKIDAIRKQSAANFEAARKRIEAESDKHAKQMAGFAEKALAEWRVRNEQRQQVNLASTQIFLLLTADQVTATPGITLASSQVGPQNNNAQFQLLTSKAFGKEEVGFVFHWQNPSDKFAVINVDAFPIVTGVLQAIEHGGIFPDSRNCSASVYVNLYLFELWNQPPTQPIPQGSQTEFSVSAYVTDGGWFDDGQIVDSSIYRGYDLEYLQLVIPGNATVQIKVAITVQWTIGSDACEANFVFVNLGRQVQCPAVIINVLT